MRVLLDTHALIWFLLDDERLSNPQRIAFNDPRNTIYVSAVNIFEIATKARIGKLPQATAMDAALDNLSLRFDYISLEVSAVHAAMAGRFPGQHRDPFDRLLAAQSLSENIPLMTVDAMFQSFGVETVWQM